MFPFFFQKIDFTTKNFEYNNHVPFFLKKKKNNPPNYASQENHSFLLFFLQIILEIMCRTIPSPIHPLRKMGRPLKYDLKKFVAKSTKRTYGHFNGQKRTTHSSQMTWPIQKCLFLALISKLRGRPVKYDIKKFKDTRRRVRQSQIDFITKQNTGIKSYIITCYWLFVSYLMLIIYL